MKSYDENGDEVPSLWEAHIYSGLSDDSHGDYWLSNVALTPYESDSQRGSFSSDGFVDATNIKNPPAGYYLRIFYKGERSDECSVEISSLNDFDFVGWGLGDIFRSTNTGMAIVGSNGAFHLNRLVDGFFTIPAQGFYGGTEIIYDAVAQSTIYEKPSQIYFLALELYWLVGRIQKLGKVSILRVDW